ncbi:MULTISPECIES: DoxX family protein [Saliphagus]|uniref:DoxX family protein n=1 Tax=Saliphagus infecundisoli TaxID=1849069 RepID=A0ABD5QDJ2_9EURY|nr:MULTISPECIES: DoxX family protein [Saliphagus]
MSRLSKSLERRANEFRSGSEPDPEVEPEPREDAAEGAVETAPLFRLGRLLFGGVLAYNAIDNLRNLEGRIAYAEAKGAPRPDISVPAISGGLLAGSVGIALWRLPSAAAAGVVGFLAGVTPVMHDFWNEEDEEGYQQELIQFLKNTALLGAALALLGLGRKSD